MKKITKKVSQKLLPRFIDLGLQFINDKVFLFCVFYGLFRGRLRSAPSGITDEALLRRTRLLLMSSQRHLTANFKLQKNLFENESKISYYEQLKSINKLKHRFCQLIFNLEIIKAIIPQ